MIDFAKITKTLAGYDCHYFGERESYGTKLHCFGVWTPTGVHEKNYDEQGRRLVWIPHDQKWEVCENDSFAITKPPKIVEVTGHVALYEKSHLPGEYYIVMAKEDNQFSNAKFIRGIKKHTFRFEVPHD